MDQVKSFPHQDRLERLIKIFNMDNKIYCNRIHLTLDNTTPAENFIPEEPDMIFAENSNNDQSEFDTIVGCIEDIVIGEKFQDLQVSQMRIITTK